MNPKLDDQNAVNGTALEFWCPSCEKRQTKRAGLVVWFNPKGIHVCNYFVCLKCFNKVAASDQPVRQSIADRCEEALLKRYHELNVNLVMTNEPELS